MGWMADHVSHIAGLSLAKRTKNAETSRARLLALHM
jgi:hypothetical protein